MTTRGPARLFYAGMGGALLLIVLLGFGRSLYLRPFFDVPAIPLLVWTHGMLLTAWFLGVFLQATLIATRRVSVHRQLGWGVAGIGVALLATSMVVTLQFVSRRSSLGTDIEARMAVFSPIVWGDIAALVSFILFFGAAFVLRTRPELHKRLMLLASLSILEPAMYRIWGWQLFGGIDRHAASLVVLLVLVLAMALYDFASRRRVEPITMSGGIFLLASRMFALFVIADSEAGHSFIRALL